MVIVSSDVTNPHIAPFIVGDHLVTNQDGSVSIALNGGATAYGGQEPNQYGVRHDDTSTGAYQRFTLSGNLLISQTRPGDQVFVYTIAVGQAF